MAVRHLTLRCGAKVPIIGLGTWNSSADIVKNAVMDAIDAGYRHIDCAHDYENEAEIGDGIKAKIDAGEVSREDVFVTSKLWLTYFAPERVKIGFEESRKKLKIEYLDLFLLHFPFAMKDSGDVENPNDIDSLSNESIDYVDTWRELIKLQKAGLAKSIGVSNFNRYQIERLIRETSRTPDVHQFECHPYLDQTDLVKFCQSQGIIVTGYSPFASPGNRGFEEPNLLTDSLLQDISTKHGKTIPQVLLRYQIQRGIVVIPKSVTPSRIVSNIDVFDFVLSNQEMESIKEKIIKNDCCAFRKKTNSATHRRGKDAKSCAFSFIVIEEHFWILVKDWLTKEIFNRNNVIYCYRQMPKGEWKEVKLYAFC